MTVIKFCGLRTPDDICAVNEIRPDYAGFILTPGFRRSLSMLEAVDLRSRLDSGILAVGVFVNESPEIVVSIAEALSLDAVQLHGQETNQQILDIKELLDIPVFQAFTIQSEADIRAAQQSAADVLLLDSGAGTGHAFNWNVIPDISRPWVLAGGLNPENAAEAVRRLRPWGVDTSSGIETEGKKDPDKMRAFAAAVREY